MRTSQSMTAVLSLLTIFVAGSRAGAEDIGARLTSLDIKYRRDAAGQIVAVELPSGSRDHHVEAILDIPTITEIKAPSCRASFERIGELKALPALASLNLDGVQNANDYVAALTGIATLKSLSFARSSLTNHGLDDLCLLYPQLEEMNVSETAITLEFSISLLSTMSKLQVLDISRIRPTIDLDGPSVRRPVTLASLARLPLKRLRASGIKVTADDIKAFASSSTLEHLMVDWKRIDRKTLIYFQSCHPQIPLGGWIARSLGFPHLANRDGRLVAVRNCPYPKFLQLPEECLRDIEELDIVGAVEDLSFLSLMPKLQRLTLYPLPKERKELVRLQSCARLTTFTVRGATIDRETADLLLAAPLLETLNLEKCQLEGNLASKIQPEDGNIRVLIKP